MSFKFTAVLTAYSADDLKNSCSKNLIISKRILLDLQFLRMEQSLKKN